jgi:ribosomal-protein-alanine N-acetyltransferase
MSLSDDLVLETHRLVLKPMEPDDADEWWQAVWSDADVTRYLPPRRPLPRDLMPRSMRRVAEHWRAHGLGVWSVREKEGSSFIGHCGLILNEPPDVELIYALARSAWGRGLATEAAGCLTALAFETRGLDQLAALVFPENTASVRVLEKLGFVLEGETTRFDAQLLRYVLCR